MGGLEGDLSLYWSSNKGASKNKKPYNSFLIIFLLFILDLVNVDLFCLGTIFTKCLLPTLHGAVGDLGTAEAGDEAEVYLAVAEVAVPVGGLLPGDARHGGLHDQNSPSRYEPDGYFL